MLLMKAKALALASVRFAPRCGDAADVTFAEVVVGREALNGQEAEQVEAVFHQAIVDTPAVLFGRSRRDQRVEPVFELLPGRFVGGGFRRAA